MLTSGFTPVLIMFRDAVHIYEPIVGGEGSRVRMTRSSWES